MTERLVTVALVADRLVEVVVVATMVAREAVPVAVMLVPVALPKRRLVIEARAEDKKLVRKLPEFTMFCEVVVPVRLIAFRVSMEVVETMPFTILVSTPVVVANESIFEFIKSKVVVAITPFVVLVRSIEFEEEALLKVLVVDEAKIAPADKTFNTPRESATTIELVAFPGCKFSNLAGST